MNTCEICRDPAVATIAITVAGRTRESFTCQRCLNMAVRLRRAADPGSLDVRVLEDEAVA